MNNFFSEAENEIRKQIFEYEVVIFGYVLSNLKNQEEALGRMRLKKTLWIHEVEEQFGETLPEYIHVLKNEETISLVEKLKNYRDAYEKIKLLKRAG